MAETAQMRAETGEGARWLVPAALLVVYLVWGSTYFAMRVALESFPPFLMAGARNLTAGVLLFALSRLRGEPVPTRPQWLSAARVGLLLLVFGNGLVVFALQWVASGLAAILIATVSLWAALFGGLFGTWPTRRQWVGIAVGLFGVALLNLDAGLRGHILGVGLLLFASVSWAFGSVWSRRLDLPQGSMASATEMMTGGGMLLLVALARGEALPRTLTLGAALAFVYLILFGSLLAFNAYMLLVRRASPAVATSYAYVNPVVAVLIGVTLGAERISANMLVALGIILAGVALVALGPRPSR